MANSLIERLNGLQNLTPDEIAKRLYSNGWVRGEVMTEAEHASLENQQVRVFKLVSGRWSDYGEYTADWGHRYIQRNLFNHWFKLEEKYEGGDHDRPYPAP